jgi:hypothetical protein
MLDLLEGPAGSTPPFTPTRRSPVRRCVCVGLIPFGYQSAPRGRIPSLFSALESAQSHCASPQEQGQCAGLRHGCKRNGIQVRH